ncbi:MAG: hypothetical protein E7672_02855, partial [Ruminococcaceae bacterium]|nr:hypothetical protein [Oscillospiraceae bacterium]
MIKFGCCIPGGSLMPEGVAEVPDSPAVQIVLKCRALLDMGYDNTECGGGLLAGLTDEEVEYLREENEKSSLKLAAVNSLFPGDFRLADPEADHAPYMERAVKIFSIMQKLGIKYAVFGSGKSRRILEGVDEEKCRETLYSFTRAMADEAEKRGITICIEPLRRSESNIFVSVPEAAEIIRDDIKHDNVKLLYDAFHMAEEGTDISCVKECADLLRHCHMAESPNRSRPGAEDSKDLSYNRKFAYELYKTGYDGVVSVECKFGDFKTDAALALDHLRDIFDVKTTFEFKAIRDMKSEPVYIKPAVGEVADDVTALVCEGKSFPASKYKDGVIAVITAARGEEMLLTTSSERADSGVEIAMKNDESKVEVLIDGNHFSEYVYDKNIKKPFFGQVVDNAGNPFTRLDLETKEHPHQRSVFIAVGSVNGVDCWNEHVENYGLVRNESITDVFSGAAYGTFTAHNRWTDREDNPLISEKSKYTVYNQSEECRVLDIETTFTADYGDVEFGKTKEAGPLGIRVREDLRADIGSGELRNSWGGVGEKECWS